MPDNEMHQILNNYVNGEEMVGMYKKLNYNYQIYLYFGSKKKATKNSQYTAVRFCCHMFMILGMAATKR
jgi:hypothetical protein